MINENKFISRFWQKHLSGNIWCECYQTSISKNIFNKSRPTWSFKRWLWFGSKGIRHDLIMQKCLDDVLKMTNPRPINISGKGSISSNLLERTLERLDKFSVVYVFM